MWVACWHARATSDWVEVAVLVDKEAPYLR